MANTCTTEICERVLALMKEGLMLEEICAQIGVTRKTLYNWRDKRCPQYDQEFDEAYELGKTYQAAWWLKTGRANLGAGKEFNTPLFGLYMANKFGSPVVLEPWVNWPAPGCVKIAMMGLKRNYQVSDRRDLGWLCGVL